MELEIDITRVTKTMTDLGISTRENARALKSAFSQVGNIVRASVRKGARSVSNKSVKEKQQGIFKTVYKRGTPGVAVGIHKVVFLPSEGGRKFSYLWVELPTKAGTGRNNRKHGATPAHHFFARSVEAALPKAESKLTELIEKQLNRVVARRK